MKTTHKRSSVTPMSNLRDKLLQAYQKGTFLEITQQAYFDKSNDQGIIGKKIAEIHNEGLINAITEFRHLTRNSEKLNFFTLTHVLQDVIPLLSSDVEPVMDCVRHLVSEAGDDLTAGSLYPPFIEFCSSGSERPKKVLELVNKDLEAWIDFLSPAISSGAKLHLSEYVEEAVKLSTDENIHVRIRAIFSLGQIDYCQDKGLINKALESLKLAVESETDDQLFSNVLRSAFSLYEADNCLENDVEMIINQCLVKGGDQMLYQASNLLWLSTKELSGHWRESLLNSLGNTNPKHNGTLNNINYALKNIVDLGDEERAIQFIEKFLKTNPDVSIEVFEYLTRRVYENDHGFLYMLVTRWFLSKEYVLGKAVLELLSVGIDSGIALTADLNQLKGLPEGINVFVARKAIGWLYTKPVSAASFIVSLIDFATEKELEEIEALLFDPLLLSYTKVKDYLDKNSASYSKKTNSVINAVKQRLKEYHEGLNTDRDIPELLPSQSHRETYSRHFNYLMQKSKKEAESKSVFFGLFKRSVLLYGRSSIHYMQISDEKPQRSETPLQSFSTSIEVPSLELFDSLGLDYMLRDCRYEGGNS